MGIKRKKRDFEQDPFTDLLFNSLLAFTLLFIVTILFLNPPAKTGIIDPKAEFIVTVTWDDNSTADIDTWVENPKGDVLWYRSPEIGLLHLDRDDRGAENDTILFDGETITNPLNQEVVTIRGVVPGQYVVNVHYYNTKIKQQVNVEISVVRVNPKLEVVYYGTMKLENKGDEKTAVRFTISKDGNVVDVNRLFKSLVKGDK